VYDGDDLLGESSIKRNSEKRITIDLPVDHVEADPYKRPFTYALASLLVAEGDEE
jgi:hypothetical protein